MDASICVHGVHLVLIGDEDENVVLDGQHETRLFDVAHGGKLELIRVDIRNGAGVHSGAAIQVRRGGRVNVTSSLISHCEAGALQADPVGGAIAAWEPSERDAGLVELDHRQLHARAVRWSPDSTRVAAGLVGHQGGVVQGDLNCVDGVCYGGDLVRVKSSVGVWHVGSSGSGTFVESDADVLTADVYDIAWAPGGERFVSGSADGKLVIWNADGLSVSQTRTMNAAVTSVDWSCTGGSDVGNGYTLTCSLEKDKQYIACGLADGSVHILDADDLSSLRRVAVADGADFA